MLERELNRKFLVAGRVIDGEGVLLHFQLLIFLAGITIILQMAASSSQNFIIPFSKVTHLIPLVLISGHKIDF